MNRSPRITAISFDGDDTLWDFGSVMRNSLEITLEELRRRIPTNATEDLDIDKMIEIRNSTAADLRGTIANLERIRLEAFRRTLDYVGSPSDELAAELNLLYLRHRFEDIELYPDVIPTLDSLGDRFVLGLLSNGNGYPERCGLPDRFSFVVFAQDVGVEKPDPEMFFEACRQAGCAPNQLMHVGDSLATDVAGANGVGTISVWLNRSGRRDNSDIQPDFEIRSLGEVIGLLG